MEQKGDASEIIELVNIFAGPDISRGSPVARIKINLTVPGKADKGGRAGGKGYQ